MLLDAGWLLYVKWAARLVRSIVYRRHTGQLKVEWPVRPKGIEAYTGVSPESKKSLKPCVSKIM